MTDIISDIHRQLAPFLVTGLAGTVLTPEEREMLSQAPPAGVILFHRNVENIEQLRSLTGEVKEIIEAASGLPPLIMADHEGGRISVLARAIGVPPSPMAAWMERSESILTRITSSCVDRMKRCGVNLTLSPVADVASQPLNPVIGTRSFGEDPESVSHAVRTSIRAITDGGMLSCLKHFPGHGSTSSDSHLTLPVIGKTVDQLMDEELPPFVAGIDAGADLMMTAHIALTEGSGPASLDSGIVTGLLRGDLGFRGVVITDALEMAGALPDGKAMRSIDPMAREKEGDEVPAMIATKALEAGNDLLLMSRPLEQVYAEIGLHSEALGRMIGEAPVKENMRESEARIASLREKAASAAWKSRVDVDSAVLNDSVNNSAEAALSKAIFPGPKDVRKSLLPVFLGERSDFDSYVVNRFISMVMMGYSGGRRGDRLVEPVQCRRDKTETELLEFEPVLGPASGRCLVLLCRRPQPEEVIRSIAAGFDMAIAAGRPWDAALIPAGIPVYVTYGIYDGAALGLVDMLRGGREPEKSD